MKIDQLVVGALSTNCYIVQDETEKETAIIDPGADKDRIRAFVEEKGLMPRVILLTHGHLDHLMAAVSLKRTYHCPLLFHRDEVLYMRSEAAKRSPYRKDIFETLLAEVEGERLLADRDTVVFGSVSLTAIEVPGHTAHSLCYYAEKEKVLFAGDTLFCGSVGRTDFYDGDGADLVRAIERRILTLPGDVAVLPGHGPRTTVSREKEQNPSLGGRYA